MAAVRRRCLLAGPGEGDHHPIDVVLPAAFALAALAHQHALRLAAGKLQHIVGDQIVIENDVRRLQCPALD